MGIVDSFEELKGGDCLGEQGIDGRIRSKIILKIFCFMVESSVWVTGVLMSLCIR